MDAHQSINWHSQNSFLSLNPRLDLEEINKLNNIYSKIKLPGHIYVTSSGSTQKENESLKLIALSHQAFLISAESVNRHLNSNQMDIWLQPLPQFHVGGLSIYARAHVSGAKVVEFPIWDKSKGCKKFFEICNREKVTLTSLVPAQLFDLLNSDLPCPANLRAIVIGGSALSMDLYKKAIEKKWPILPSYGMTEVCSQIATAEVGSALLGQSQLKILSHINLRISEDQLLEIQSPSLMTGFGQIRDEQILWQQVASGSWYQTADIGKLEGHYLTVNGRKTQYVKVLGEGVNLELIQSKFDSLLSDADPTLKNFCQVISKTDERQGHKVALKVFKGANEQQISIILSLIQSWNQKVNPVERIQAVDYVDHLSWKRNQY